VLLTFAINGIVLTFLIVAHPFPPINLPMSILVRQDDLINISFSLIARLPSILPISSQKTVANLHHYGSVHIGCAVSALLWYCFVIAMSTRECIHIIKERSMTGRHWVNISWINSVLLVATGACFHPMLSLLPSPAVEKMRADGKQVQVLWCVCDPDAPHWAFVQRMIRNVDPSLKSFKSRLDQ
jgi:hypothetical protein